jgi:diaminopimelate epimerase
VILAFTKMNGAGNDFVVIDNRAGGIELGPEQVVRLCDRQRGVGADGVILLEMCVSGKADWAWQFFNSDGSIAEMCGNGARCFARFVQRVAGVGGRFTFETGAGVVTAELVGDRVRVGLTAPTGLRLNDRIELISGIQTVHSINTGVPHAVVLVEDADRAMVQAVGEEIRRHVHFAPRGTNVNFVQLLGRGSIRVRTFERGVEGETLACGTGVTASALVCSRLFGYGAPVRVRVQGGDELEVDFREVGEGFGEVRLTGPADFVFEGEIDLPGGVKG